MRCTLRGRFDMYISKVNWGQVICPQNRGCPLFRESVIVFNVVYSECLMSAIEGLLCYVCMKGGCINSYGEINPM